MWQVQTSRRGLILFVVVAMLALFAVVAVAFFYYAGQEQLLTHVAMENQNRTRPDPDALMVYALRWLCEGDRIRAAQEFWGDTVFDPVSTPTAFVYRPFFGTTAAAGVPFEDVGGNVRNLPDGIPVKLPTGQVYYGSDSFWTDLGFPPQAAPDVGPDGQLRVYKPLFAFLIRPAYDTSFSKQPKAAWAVAPYPMLEPTALWSLEPYPPVVDLINDPPYDPKSPTPKQQLAKSIAQRQKLAREIYFRLLAENGLLDNTPLPPGSAPTWYSDIYPSSRAPWPPKGARPRVATNPINPSPEDLAPLRRLAQLAVNIVDYLDQDNYSTPFMFYTDSNGYPLDDPRKRSTSAPPPNLLYWVFGRDRPGVVINEALFEYQVRHDDTQNQDVVYMRCWVELLNPDPVSTPLTLGADDPKAAPVRVNASRYKLLIAAYRHQGEEDPISGAMYLENVLGECKQADKRTETDDQDFLKEPPPMQTQPTPPWQLPNPSPASDDLNDDRRYLLVGPKGDQQEPVGDTADSTIQKTSPRNWIRAPSGAMKFSMTVSGNDWFYMNSSEPETKMYLVLLRRLAFPQMNKLDTPQTLSMYPDPQTGNTIPDYHPDLNPLIVNPYITVDMMVVKQGQGLCDRTLDAQGNPTGESRSWERTDPYTTDLSSGAKGQTCNQQIPNTQTYHTLGKPNSTPPNSTSNLFAVWCTVGFFDTQRWLELDADRGKQVRYRFFAIVDYSTSPPRPIYWSRIQ